EGVCPKLHHAALPSWSPQEEERLRSALATIPADDYDRWVACGMALCDLHWIREGTIDPKTGGRCPLIEVGLEIFDWWSATCPEKYPGRAEIERKWLSFDGPYRGSRVSVASIYHRARECGWTDNFGPPPSGASHCDRTGEVHQEQGQQDQKNHQGQEDRTNQQGQEDRTNQQEQGGPTGREQGEGAQSREGVSATPFQAFDFAKIPPRQWLYGRHYVRKYVTATVAPGGSAKTASKLSETVSMAIGRDLLDCNKPIDRLRVWYWNGEDPLDEINRRLAAICVYYKVVAKELEGWLFIDSGHDMPICLATENRGGVVISEEVIHAINGTLEQDKIDVMILDPFIAIHRVSENNNPLIDQVVKVLGKIANQNNCAIEIVHHVRKPSIGQQEITADDTRGGGAIVNAVRSCQLLNRMSKTEAEQVRIEQDLRFRYFRI